MQFQERAQLALGLVQLGLGRAGGRMVLQLDPQPLGGRAQRIALHVHLLGHDETLALQRPHGLIGQRQRARQVGGRERPFFEHAQDLRHRVVRRRIEQKLARGVAAGIGQRPDLAAPDFGGQRQHAPQHVAQRRAVIAGDPAAQRQQLRAQHRLGIDQPQRLARGHRGRLVVAAQDHAGQLARPERHHQPAARPHAVAQRLRQRVGERLIERHRQADVAVKIGSLGHEPPA